MMKNQLKWNLFANLSLICLSLCATDLICSKESWSRMDPGTMILQTDFEEADPLKDWLVAGREGTTDIVQHDDNHWLRVVAPSHQMIARVKVLRTGEGEAFSSLRGHVLRFKARIKGRNLTPPSRPWLGVKLMAKIIQKGQVISYPSAHIPIGDNPRNDLNSQVFSFTFLVPEDCLYIVPYLGLQGVEGQVDFDDVSLSVVQAPFQPLLARGTRLFKTGFEEKEPLKNWNILGKKDAVNIVHDPEIDEKI
ncbi:secreted protein, partial [Candidatus Thiomargarita nelsonii]